MGLARQAAAGLTLVSIIVTIVAVLRDLRWWVVLLLGGIAVILFVVAVTGGGRAAPDDAVFVRGDSVGSTYENVHTSGLRAVFDGHVIRSQVKDVFINRRAPRRSRRR